MTTLIRRNQNDWLPSIFNDFFEHEWMGRTNATAPAINVKEMKDRYTVEVAAPGMTKEDFHINIDADNHLVLSASRIFVLEVPAGDDSAGRCGQRQNLCKSRKWCAEYRSAQTLARRDSQGRADNRNRLIATPSNNGA